MMAPSCSRFMIGIVSMSGTLDMITAQACTPHCLLRPSSPLARSTADFTSASESYSARNWVPSEYRASAGSKIFASGTSLPISGGGIALVIRSPTENGMPSTLAASLAACLALMVP